MSSSMKEQGVVVPRVGLSRRIAAGLTWAFHVVVVVFLLGGWALPWPAAWWTYALGAPVVQLGWIVFSDYCWLSIVEAKLRGETLVRETEAGDEEARVFVGELIEMVFKRSVSRRVSNLISYGVLWGGFAAAVFRIYSND